MKKILLALTVLFLCVNLISCSDVLTYLSYTISGEIIDPVGDFSRGDDKGTLVFGGEKYIYIDEFAGDFEIEITDEDVHLGDTSNWPFFPNTGYYANKAENPEYIAAEISAFYATMVYLREDLCINPLTYVLQDIDYEFDFSSAFIKTDRVSYDKDVHEKNQRRVDVYFYAKDYPRLTVRILIYEIDGKWYYIKTDEAFILSEGFLNTLMNNDLLQN